MARFEAQTKVYFNVDDDELAEAFQGGTEKFWDFIEAEAVKTFHNLDVAEDGLDWISEVHDELQES